MRDNRAEQKEERRECVIVMEVIELDELRRHLKMDSVSTNVDSRRSCHSDSRWPRVSEEIRNTQHHIPGEIAVQTGHPVIVGNRLLLLRFIYSFQEFQFQDVFLSGCQQVLKKRLQKLRAFIHQ